MQTKHFIEDATHLVNTALQSLTITNPSLAFDAENKIVYRRPEKHAEPKVSIITGGGSGHEPGFAGFVGKVPQIDVPIPAHCRSHIYDRDLSQPEWLGRFLRHHQRSKCVEP